MSKTILLILLPIMLQEGGVTLIECKLFERHSDKHFT
jgi:hypothetical protein